MNEWQKAERMKERKHLERKDEIIALYLSSPHSVFSTQQTWNEKKEEKKKESCIQSGTQQILSMSKGIPYWVGSDCFCYLRHSGVSMSVLFPAQATGVHAGLPFFVRSF
jgi:hypothetical protein